MPTHFCPICKTEWNSPYDLGEALRTLGDEERGLIDDINEIAGPDLFLPQDRPTCPTCLEARQKELSSSGKRLERLMRAWEELDPLSSGLTVTEAVRQFRQNPKAYSEARATFFALGSTQNVKRALSQAEHTVCNGRRFETHGQRNEETVWRLVGVQ